MKEWLKGIGTLYMRRTYIEDVQRPGFCEIKTKIGKIISGNNRSIIIDEKCKQIPAKYKGYIHQF